MENKNLTVEKIIEITQGKLISGSLSTTINTYSIDSRDLEKNDLFISLNIEKGIKYIEDAFKKGAIGCITEYEIPEGILEKNKDKIIIKVNNVINSIQELAKYKRKLYDMPVIAITGSVGKTSTKDMISTVLEQRYIVSKTQGNYNNHIGVPITILNWKIDTTAAVVEMGMNHLGEIEILSEITRPTIAVITNIGTAHIGNLGSRENILKAKLEILEGIKKHGKIILNNDNDLLNNVNSEKCEKITYGIEKESDYKADNIIIYFNNSEYNIKIENKIYKINVPVGGEHFIYNSLCALAVGKTLNIEMDKIINGIKLYKTTEKRNEIIEKNNLKIINDYYNASFDSMKASLELLSKIKSKRKIAILGDMLELGKFSEELHRKVGQEVAKNHIDVLIVVGDLSKTIFDEAKKLGIKEAYQFSTNEKCIDKIDSIVKKGDAILIKASNKMNFGEISSYLQNIK